MKKLPYKTDFTDKVIVITGAGGLIAGELALAFAACGASVAALDRNEQSLTELERTAAEKGLNIKGFYADVLKKDTLVAAHMGVLSHLGSCDVLINAAGGNHPAATTDNEFNHTAKEAGKGFFELTEDGLDKVMRLNFMGTLLPSQVFMADMVKKGSGCVLNISSMNAYTPLTKIPAYSAAKAGVSNLTAWLAAHFAGSGIRVNAIAPGFIASEQNRQLLYNPDGTPTPRAGRILAKTPMGRFVEAQELVGASLFLCDNRSSGAITGIVLPIDAGFLAYSGV